MKDFCNEFETVEYSFSTNETIGNIVRLLCDDLQFEEDDLMLYHKSVYLKEFQRLSFYENIKDKSIIRVVQRSTQFPKQSLKKF